MKYRLTALTPLLVGGGDRLAPIDYMVWKDQINVLDQHRIFRLLSKGPRLEGYLGQLRKAEKLDFASWGGFAQNYAARRIAFEHATSTPVWERERAEYLHIPTFAAGPHGPYLPASALKGALRTALAFTRWNPGVIRELATRSEGERGLRRPGEAAEAMTLGPAANDPMRTVSVGDSEPVHPSVFRIYLVRVATLAERGGRLELAWKQAPRGNATTASGSTPIFAEMAPPRTSFTGDWKVTPRGQTRKDHQGHERLFQATHEHAAKLLDAHREYANTAGLSRVGASLEAVSSLLEEIRQRRDACVINLGWAGGFLGKTAFLDTANEDFRKLLRSAPAQERAVRTGLPFPKTRRVVFEKGEPANLAGWAMLEVG
jgi:CRISPR-associated protein Csm5